MRFEYLIALDISGSNTGITVWNLETKTYRAYSVNTSKFTPLQKAYVEHFGKDYEAVINSSIINVEVKKIVTENFTEYSNYAKEEVLRNTEKGVIKNIQLEPLIVHIVPEKAFIPFGTPDKPLKFRGSDKTSKYYGMFMQQLLSTLATVSYGSLIPLVTQLMPRQWQAVVGIAGGRADRKGLSLIKASELGLTTKDDNVSDSFLIGMAYIKKYYPEVLTK